MLFADSDVLNADIQLSLAFSTTPSRMYAKCSGSNPVEGCKAAMSTLAVQTVAPRPTSTFASMLVPCRSKRTPPSSACLVRPVTRTRGCAGPTCLPAMVHSPAMRSAHRRGVDIA